MVLAVQMFLDLLSQRWCQILLHLSTLIDFLGALLTLKRHALLGREVLDDNREFFLENRGCRDVDTRDCLLYVRQPGCTLDHCEVLEHDILPLIFGRNL